MNRCNRLSRYIPLAAILLCIAGSVFLLSCRTAPAQETATEPVIIGEGQEAWELQWPPMPNEKPFVRCTTPIAVKIPIKKPLTFTTADKGVLRFNPPTVVMHISIDYLYQATKNPKDDWPIDTIRIRHQVTDAKGRVWTAETYRAADSLTDIFKQALEQNAVILYAQVSSDWRQALHQQLLLSGVRDTGTGNDVHLSRIGRYPIAVVDEDIAPVFDIAVLGKSQAPSDTLLLRITDVFAVIGNPTWKTMLDEDGIKEPNENATLPPLACTVPATQLLLQNDVSYKYATGKQVEKKTPAPVIFTRSSQTAPAQARVIWGKKRGK